MSPSIMDKFPANTKFVVIKPPVKRRPAIIPSGPQPSISTTSSPVSTTKVTSAPQPATTTTKRKFEAFEEIDNPYKDAKRARLNESVKATHDFAPQSSPNKRRRSDEVASEETRPAKQLKTDSLPTTSGSPARNQENTNPATRSVRGVSPKTVEPRTQPLGTCNLNKKPKSAVSKDKAVTRKLSAIADKSVSKAVAPDEFQSEKAKGTSTAKPAPARPKQSASHKPFKASKPVLSDGDTLEQAKREKAAAEEIVRRNKDKALKKWRADQHFSEVSDRVRNIFDDTNRPRPRISDYTETIIQVCKDFGLGNFLDFSTGDQKRMLEEVRLRNAWTQISKQYNKAHYSYHHHKTPANEDALNQEEDLKHKFESRNPQFVEEYEYLTNEKNRRSKYSKKWRAERCREEFFTNGPWACQHQANKARAAAAPGQKRK